MNFSWEFSAIKALGGEKKTSRLEVDLSAKHVAMQRQFHNVGSARIVVNDPCLFLVLMIRYVQCTWRCVSAVSPPIFAMATFRLSSFLSEERCPLERLHW